MRGQIYPTRKRVLRKTGPQNPLYLNCQTTVVILSYEMSNLEKRRRPMRVHDLWRLHWTVACQLRLMLHSNYEEFNHKKDPDIRLPPDDGTCH